MVLVFLCSGLVYPHQAQAGLFDSWFGSPDVCKSNPNSLGCNGSIPLIKVTNNNATTMCVNDTAPGAQISLPINGSCPASAPNSISKPSVVCTEDGNIFLPAANGACPDYAPAHKNGVPTQQYNKTLTYTPLEPLPGYSALNGTQDFGKLVSLLFKLLIGAGALIAVGSFVYAGVYYMFSEISVTNKSWAKKKIQSSFFGLFLLMGSWLILNTINQQLVVFGNGLSPVQENIATGFQQAPQSQLQRDIEICQSERGTLKYQMTGGVVQGCPLGSDCSNAISPSSGYCLLSKTI